MQCKECGTRMPDGRVKICSDECRKMRERTNSISISTRHRILRRILEHEIVPMSDPLWNPAIFESLLLQGCHYCHVDLINVTGISLDRVIDNGKHTYLTTVGCCSICNRIRSRLDTGGFAYEEMRDVIGPAVALVRRNRILNSK